MSIIKTLLSNPLVKARALQVLQGASMAAGAWAMTSSYVFLSTHGVSNTDALSIATVVSTAVAGLILSLGSMVYSQMDVTRVDTKIQIAAITGSVQAVNDKQAIQVAKTVSGSPEALQEALRVLQEGKE